MKTRTILSVGFLLASLLVVGCGADSAGYDNYGDDDDDSGGAVSFGEAQDIGQFRDIIQNGGVPAENTLDANGFFNEHYVELPAPDCGQSLCGHAMLAVGSDWIDGSYQAALQLGMSSTVDPSELERPPLNLVLAVDTSGSMSAENRLAYVKAGIDLLLDNLEPEDRLALVTYSDNASVAIGFESESGVEHARAMVSEMYPAGSTNLYAGLELAFQQAAEAFDLNRQNRVILLSDGEPTVGVMDTGMIVEMAQSYISDGIGLTTIGVGDRFNVDLMRSLSERGAGNFYYLEDAQAIQEVFTEELSYFVTPIAVGVSLELWPGAHYQLGEVVGTRLWENQGESGSVFVPAVFLASRTSTEPGPNGRRGGGSALFARMLPQDARCDEQLAEVQLSYRMPGSAEQIEQTLDIFNPTDPSALPEEVYLSHQAMAKNYAMYNIYLGLRAATRLASSYSALNCALATLEQVSERATAWNEERPDPDIAADIELMQQFAANLRREGAVSELIESVAWCQDGTGGWGEGYDDGYYDEGDDWEDDDYCGAGPCYGCSVTAGAGPAGSTPLAMLLVLVGLLWRRHPERP